MLVPTNQAAGSYVLVEDPLGTINPVEHILQDADASLGKTVASFTAVLARVQVFLPAGMVLFLMAVDEVEDFANRQAHVGIVFHGLSFLSVKKTGYEASCVLICSLEQSKAQPALWPVEELDEM